MRLTLWLLKWPKTRPQGHIWSGKDRMVPRLLAPNRHRLEMKVEREKQNVFYLLHPAVNFDAEDRFHQHMASIQPSETDIKQELEKAKLEGTDMAPIPISNHYDVLNMYNSFEKE